MLLRDLVTELKAMGVADAVMDEHGDVLATIPATTPKADVPVIGVVCHVDTSPEMSGAGEQNFHSRFEWVSVQDMEKSAEVIVAIARVWEEQAP